jgi:hypothetical protein
MCLHYFQSNCAGFELSFFEADTGMYIPAASRLRDVKWATQNCTLGRYWLLHCLWAISYRLYAICYVLYAICYRL